ncbi:MAG: nitrate transporter, partial [Pseudomonadota bacterium]
AARWLNEPKNRLVTAELLAQPSYVDVSTEIIERALAGSLVTTAEGESAQAPQFLKFFDGAAQFPWRSQAVWIATQLAVRLGLDRSEAAVAARACFRSDLYRQNIGVLGIDLPLASEKLEGTMSEPIAARSTAGEIMLGPDSFFDGQVFDPVGV